MLGHRCRSVTVGATIISCAEICAEWTSASIANYSLVNNALVDESIINSEVQYSWQLTMGDIVIYDFGKGDKDTVIAEMSNGSTNSNFIVGLNGNDVRVFLSSLPIFYNGEVVGLRLTLSDNYGRESKKIKYYLTQ